VRTNKGLKKKEGRKKKPRKRASYIGEDEFMAKKQSQSCRTRLKEKGQETEE